MPAQTTAGLRLVADNLDRLADEAADRRHERRAAALRNNARFVRRAAEHFHKQESAMGKFADKIHAVEKERDDAKAQAIALASQLSQAGEAQQQLDALTAAGKIADDADVAALTDDPENQPPPAPPVTSPADTVAGGAGADTTAGAGAHDQTAAVAVPQPPVPAPTA